MKTIIDQFKSSFSAMDIHIQRDDLYFVTVKKELAVPAITWLRDIQDFSHFVFLTAVDWIEDGKFQLTYMLNHPSKHINIGVRTFIDRDNAGMVSAHHLWEQVATYQRELKEMFGIDFPGSPRVDEPFLLEGWDDIPPMRRDFDTLKYSEETYFPRPGRKTEDPAEHMKKNLYPDEKKLS